MSLTCTISETMSGHLSVNDETHDISIQLDAFSDTPMNLTAPRPFTGYCYWNGDHCLHAEGTLTLLPSGPAYEIRLADSPLGPLLLKGKKQYQLKNLIKSMTHCPLTAYELNTNTLIGKGEIAYRKPLWKFPLESVRFAL